MSVEIRMPKLSQTAEEVRLIRWLVQTGDTVNKGDPLCEVENDKTTMEVESFAGGTVLSLSGQPDSMIAGGTVIAVLGDPGEKASDATAAGGPPRRTTATTQPAAPQPPALKPEDAATAPGTYLSENQKIIGRNLQASKAKIPHYYLKISILSDRLLSWRQANILPDGSRVSINSILIYAAARALKRFPRLNACFRESRMQLNPEINVGLAVSAGEDLYVPVVRGVGEKGIQEIDRELKWLVAKTQSGRLELEDVNGGTFTVSNLGMYPVDEFCAIISPPQVAILAFGRIRKKVVVDDQGAMQIRSTFVATGSFDHRVVNGAQGAAFLAEVKKIVEEEL